MGVGGIFSGGVGSRGFSQNFFQGGAKSGEIWFLPLEMKKKQYSFANNFKIQGGARPPLPPPFRRPWIQVKKCSSLTVLVFWWLLVNLNELALFRRKNVSDILPQTDVDFWNAC